MTCPHGLGAGCSECGAQGRPDPTTESRIRINLNDWYEASSEYNHYSWRAQNAKAVMDRAVRNLKALGATAALEKLNVRAD